MAPAICLAAAFAAFYILLELIGAGRDIMLMGVVVLLIVAAVVATFYTAIEQIAELSGGDKETDG